MKNNEPVVVFAGTPQEADFVRSILEADGITAFLMDEFMGGIASFISPGGSGAVKVLVESHEAERALYLIQNLPHDGETF